MALSFTFGNSFYAFLFIFLPRPGLSVLKSIMNFNLNVLYNAINMLFLFYLIYF